MIARTTLKKLSLEGVIPRDRLDRSFNRAGLCAYCSRKFHCSLSADYGLVYECDDYDASDSDVPMLTFSSIGLSENKDDEDFSGLCHDCQKRDYCQLRKISGGVWHCQEFIG
ncbi:MAG TPA: hypothetical protein PKI63_04155 [Candidatus Cloacimonadota bacterium]|nr:hypothetical protein [Candidatus Cloacimonadota bacterium]HOH78855.1 hypothetical protein [Candidatus Cloacimonadota bacterium]HPN41336.1 hypothetical protein [Candidatus Cloacimonadota bacterium]